MQYLGKHIILFGFLMVLVGLIWYFFYDKLSFLGRLPGDIRIEKENFKFYFPLTTFLLLSLAVNLLFRFIKIFFKF